MHHRLWECCHPEVKKARDRITDDCLRQRAQASGQTSVLYNNGILPHPADRLPPPCAQDRWEFARNDGTRCTGDTVPKATPTMHGNLFTDGHASRTGIHECDRASWAVVQIDDQGEVVAYLRGSVPRTFPQTSQSSEYLAAAFTAHVMDAPSDVTSDCSNVVRDLSKPREEWDLLDSTYAGVLRAVAGHDHRTT